MAIIEQFRVAFGMASVICKNGILTAAYRKAWCAPEQTIQDDSLLYLIWLMNECEYVEIRLSDGVSADISFGLNKIVSDKTTIFTPMFPDKTKEEVDAILAKAHAESRGASLLTKYLDGVDMNDKQDLAERLLRFFADRREAEGLDTNVTSIPALQRWQSIRKRVKEFTTSNPVFECEFSDEDYFAEVWFSSAKRRSVRLNRETCRKIASVFERCDAINICGDPRDDESFFTVTLYVDKMSK